MPLDELLANYRPGSQDAPWTWDDEYSDLWNRDREKMTELAATIAADGIREPILLGTDGRIWDGHHRICIAIHTHHRTVPVTDP